jgi:hypothetical protein
VSATWKIRGVGGAAKRDTHPCHCCPITSADLAVPNGELCERWCKENHADLPDWFCYHKDFLSEERTEELEQEMAELATKIGDLVPNIDEIRESSAIRTDEDPRYGRANSNKDNTSIHFDFNQPEVRGEQRTGFADAVSEDLLLRGLGVQGTLEERCTRLKTSLEMEWLHKEISDAIAHGNKAKVNALFTLLDTVPCILHMENRCGLKIITMLLIEGLSNALKAVTFEDIDSEMK